MRRLRHINRTYRLLPFAEHWVIQTNRWIESLFRTSVGHSAASKEELLELREALINACFAKCREGVQGKKRLRVKKGLKSIALEVQK